MNTTELLEAIKRAVSAPTYQGRYPDSAILALANEALSVTVLPLLTGARQNFLVSREDIPVQAGVATYRIPRRALFRTLRSIQFLDNANAMVRLTQFLVEQIPQFTGASATPAGFVIEGDQIRLLPTPAQDGTLACWYNRRPSTLVPLSRTSVVNQVVNQDPYSYIQVTDVAVTSAITGVYPAATVDVTAAYPGFDLVGQGLRVQGISGNQLFLTDFNASTPLTTVSQGDVVSVAEESSIVQLPEPLTHVLVQAVAVTLCQGLGYSDQLQLCQQRLDLLSQKANEAISPRVEGQTFVINNVGSLARRTGTYRRLSSGL